MRALEGVTPGVNRANGSLEPTQPGAALIRMGSVGFPEDAEVVAAKADGFGFVGQSFKKRVHFHGTRISGPTVCHYGGFPRCWEPPVPESGFLRNQTDPQGETHQAGNVMDVEAIHQLHAMVFDGLGTELEHFGDALGVLAFSDELEHLALAAR